jgi:hypothetical protein
MCHLSTIQRQEIARQLSERYLDKLEYIHANEIKNQVQESGCVSDAQIARALQTQQNRMNPTPQWHTAKSVVSPLQFGDRNTDRFDCPVMRTGVHYWTLSVEMCAKVWLGIVRPDNTSWSGLWFTQSGTHEFHIGCGCGSETATAKPLRQSRGFRKGSMVEFALDLREENSDNGTLSVRVDGSSFQTLFSDLISSPKDRENGFWPAAQGRSGDVMAVRIVALRS